MPDEYDFQDQFRHMADQERAARRILKVPEDADLQAIRTAFHRIAMECHPDRNPSDPGADRRFREALAAYEFLLGRRDRLDTEDPPGGGKEPRIGKYRANEWGYFCHWKEAFMDDFMGGTPGARSNPEVGSGRRKSARGRKRRP